MNKSQIRELELGTRTYVLAHAKWQKKKGRKPSVTYRGMNNPRKALCLAQWEEGFLAEHCT